MRTRQPGPGQPGPGQRLHRRQRGGAGREARTGHQARIVGLVAVVPVGPEAQVRVAAPRGPWVPRFSRIRVTLVAGVPEVARVAGSRIVVRVASGPRLLLVTGLMVRRLAQVTRV